MTSLARELGAEQDLDAFATTVRDRFGEVYERTPVEVAADELAERVRDVDALAGRCAGATVGAMEPRPLDERLHVTRSRANPGGARGGRGAPVPRAQAALAEGPGARAARPTGTSSR